MFFYTEKQETRYQPLFREVFKNFSLHFIIYKKNKRISKIQMQEGKKTTFFQLNSLVIHSESCVLPTFFVVLLLVCLTTVVQPVEMSKVSVSDKANALVTSVCASDGEENTGNYSQDIFQFSQSNLPEHCFGEK